MNKVFLGARSTAVALAAVALVAVALVAGCSSTTSGSGSNGGGSGSGAGSGSSPGAGVSAPAGASGGTGSFCHDWNTISSDLTNITSGDVRARLVAKFDTLAAEAPAAVRSDVDMIDQYIHSLMAGNPDTGKAQQFGQAFAHVGVWIAQNC